VKEFSEFGNMLLLEPTSWKWDYTHQKSSEDYIVIFSGFHQVRDELGAPTKGQHILDAQVFRLIENQRHIERHGSLVNVRTVEWIITG
jgi:hypothetical protein